MSEATSAYQATVTAMGMPFRITMHEPQSESAAAEAVAAFHRALLWADDVFSPFKDDSELTRMNRGELAVDECQPEMLEVLQSCEWFRSATLGGFDARRPDHLDPTGLVKGWAVARGAAVFDHVGAQSWMVGAAGDVLVSGEGRRWRLGIADPRLAGDPHQHPVVDVVSLGGPFRAVATSGTIQRGPHIWDPTTGEAAEHFLQVSVVGPDLVTADAWATAIAGGGEHVRAAALDAGLEALVITRANEDGTLGAEASAGWPSLLCQ